jgi:L-threonylcarbamoyladenylate synthase
MKGRPESKPILLLVESLAMAGRLAVLSKTALSLAERFWPGPLTMILPSQPGVPDILTAGTGTVGIRWPQADFAMRLIHAWKQPITATSANRSGRGSCVTVSEVREQLGDSVDLIIDGGELPTRGGSTLLDLTGPRARVLREGPILEVELRGVLK